MHPARSGSPPPLHHTAVVLAMHGEPPRDFHRADLARFFQLQAQPQRQHNPQLEQEYRELERRLRAWPRTPDNDPFHAGAHQLGQELARQLGCPVQVGFHEFCAPSVEQALQAAAQSGVRRVVVLTPMATPGGSHSAREIPALVARVARSFPRVQFVYAWPFPLPALAAFLAQQARRFLEAAPCPASPAGDSAQQGPSPQPLHGSGAGQQQAGQGDDRGGEQP